MDSGRPVLPLNFCNQRLKTATWNSAGLCGRLSRDKFKPVLQLLKTVDIMAIQESHDDGTVIHNMVKDLGFTVFSSVGGSNWGGCAIIVKNNLLLHNSEHEVL